MFILLEKFHTDILLLHLKNLELRSIWCQYYYHIDKSERIRMCTKFPVFGIVFDTILSLFIDQFSYFRCIFLVFWRRRKEWKKEKKERERELRFQIVKKEWDNKRVIQVDSSGKLSHGLFCFGFCCCLIKFTRSLSSFSRVAAGYDVRFFHF